MEREYLLERCLRLEALVAGIALEPAQRRELADPLPSAASMHPKHQYRNRRAVTANEIAQMRELRRRGFQYNEIARRTSRSVWTARQHTKDVLIKREAK